MKSPTYLAERLIIGVTEFCLGAFIYVSFWLGLLVGAPLLILVGMSALGMLP